MMKRACENRDLMEITCPEGYCLRFLTIQLNIDYLIKMLMILQKGMIQFCTKLYRFYVLFV